MLETAPKASLSTPSPDWREDLRTSLRTADDLLREGIVSPAEALALQPVLARYTFLLPRYYANLIDRTNPRCPIRLQSIPDPGEGLAVPGFVSDPLADLEHRPSPRITHRYQGRLLLHLTPNCSMYCRFCFRKTLLNDLSEELFEGSVKEALIYIRQHREVEEVILSGGDPLLASPALLESVLLELKGLGHIRRIRLHSRVPVTLPSRIDQALATLLAGLEKPVVIVTHFNHPKELTPQSQSAVQLLKNAGILVLNQAVLLKDVNDRLDALLALMKGLGDWGVLPYYLHHPDRAEGTAHFDVSPLVGLALLEELKKRLPGYLVPRYVVDRPGEPYKKDLGSLISDSE